VQSPDFKKGAKAPTLLLDLRVRWRPLSGISFLTKFGGVPLTAVNVVLGRSRRNFGSVLLVARGMPLGDGVKDDLEVASDFICAQTVGRSAIVICGCGPVGFAAISPARRIIILTAASSQAAS
jgi:hypothetical protein